MSTNKRSDDEIYDVSTYSDAELFDILDLSQPTDRELEAKIIFLYRKYKNMQNKSGDELAQFFLDIHNHFFENEKEEEDDEETEGVEQDETTKEGMTTLLDLQKQKSIEVDEKNSGNNKLKTDISTDTRSFITDNKNAQVSSQTINYVKQLDYTNDSGNPILKETITRMISIDSQYRADKKALPTAFTFDLSDPLKDVVSLSLYSVQIPYTWYTIAKSYGSNFFYIKGNSPGINNGNHDIQIPILAGNYSPKELEGAVNSSIKNNYALHTDISFTTTNIAYGTATSLSTIQIGIINQYSENSYHLNFPNWTTPNIYLNGTSTLDDVTRGKSSISSFLGFNQQNYLLNTINSSIFTNIDIGTNNAMNYRIDPLSTTITVIKYTSIINTDSITGDISACYYIPGVTTIDFSFSITLSLRTDGTKYSRNSILTDLSNQLFNNQYLSKESFVKLVTITDSTDSRYNQQYGSNYYKLKLKPNRYKTNNITNSKFIIQFPDETTILNTNTKIWTGNNSCFNFLNLSNELQLLTGETPIVKQTKLNTILQGPYVALTCIHSNFISSANDISFSLQVNQNDGSDIYTDAQIVDSINAGILLETARKPFLDGLPSLSYSYDQLRPPSNTIAFLDSTHTFSLAIDIMKIFNNKNYYIDFTDTSFNSVFNLGNDSLGNPVSNSPLTSLTGIRGTSDRITLNSGSILFYVKPNGNNQDICGNLLDTIGPITYNDTSNNFTDFNTLSTKITSYLQNYTYQGNKLFMNTNTIFNITTISNQNIQISLDLYINRVITSKDYSIQFIDNENPNYAVNDYYNFWEDPLNISRNITSNFIDNSFDLSNNSPYLTKYEDSTAIVVKASLPIEVVTINFSSIPNKFEFIADEDGVETSLGTNNVVVTVPKFEKIGTTDTIIEYTRDMLITALNKSLANNPLSKGSYFYLTPADRNHNYYVKLRININKIYRATDYKIVFYDTVSFVQCFVGAAGVQNTTWDSTLGWILGYRNSTYYTLSDYTPDENYIVTIQGDTGVSTNLYNYFMICLDDFNLNHLDDGLVTITGQDTSVPLPTYADRSNFTCEPVPTNSKTKKLVYGSKSTTDRYSQLTQNQLYALAQKSNAKNTRTSNILGGESSSAFGRGPFSKDVFAIIPLKLNGLQNGQYFVEFGGTLQNNNRFYFGPVNIHRMSIKLISDKGNTVDLNGTNWSFSFICQQLYKQDKK